MRTALFRHQVAFYEDEDAYLGATVPFLREGLEAGEPALVAVGLEKAELLRGQLGRETETIRFENIEAVGCNPARILPVWREFVDAQPAGTTFRGIGEPVWPGRDAAEVDECERHEGLLNLAFGDGRAWALLCPYDSAALPDEVLVGALHTHPENGATAAPEPFAGELPDPPAEAAEFEYDADALHELRGFAARAAANAGLSDERAEDLILAVSELATNSIVHGGGNGRARAWAEPGGLLFETRDAGQIEGPLAGRVRPAPTQEKGRGLWVVNQVCDLVQIRSSESGTAVRLRLGLD